MRLVERGQSSAGGASARVRVRTCTRWNECSVTSKYARPDVTGALTRMVEKKPD
jgi:hypothetical protein